MCRAEFKARGVKTTVCLKLSPTHTRCSNLLFAYSRVQETRGLEARVCVQQSSRNTSCSKLQYAYS